jgi:tRNA-specific 2-thiouridylase
VIVGSQSALAVTELAGSRFTWCGTAKDHPEEWFEAEVQVRAHAEPVICQAAVIDGEFITRVTEPIMGVAPGQTAVVYLGTRVLGQFTIDRTISALSVEEEFEAAR